MQSKILHIARWCSARVYKQVLAQQSAGWDVTLMAQMTPHPKLHEMVKKTIGWVSSPVLRDMYYDCKVIHTTISTWGDRHLITPAPRNVIDIHDLVGQLDVGFDAVTCPGRRMADFIGSRAHVVYSKVPKMLIPEPVDCVRSGIVFQGTMGNDEPWADYSDLEHRLGEPVYFYPSADHVKGHDDCRIMKKLPYLDLLRALTMYERGYAGAANELVNIHECVTNKFWEYKAAGLDVITWRSDEMTELNELYDVDDLDITMESELDAMAEAYGI